MEHSPRELDYNEQRSKIAMHESSMPAEEIDHESIRAIPLI
jgi:hypothetical protein